MMLRSLPIALGVLAVAVAAHGQTPPAGTSGTPPPVVEESAKSTWSFSVSAYSYVVPDDRNYVQPTVMADHDWLHLEARYNYEDLDTGSAWVGYNLSGGEQLTWEFTPLLGGVFGNTTGLAPGYRGSLAWRKLEFYSEGEFVWDAGDSSESYFYTWSELTLAPVDWLRLGLVTQRTRTYHSDRDVQRGFLTGASWRRWDFTTYVFNLHDKPTWVFAATVAF